MQKLSVQILDQIPKLLGRFESISKTTATNLTGSAHYNLHNLLKGMLSKFGRSFRTKGHFALLLNTHGIGFVSDDGDKVLTYLYIFSRFLVLNLIYHNLIK